MNTEIPLGAHIYSIRYMGAYNHHGIYVGNDEVVQYSGFSKGLCSGPVNKVSLEEFLDGNTEFCIRDYKDTCFTPEEVVERALSRLGENEYNPVKKNCEHFATWAHTDKEGGIECLMVAAKAFKQIIKVWRVSDKRMFVAEGAVREALHHYGKHKIGKYQICSEKRYRIVAE
jgi:hypothetical protein